MEGWIEGEREGWRGGVGGGRGRDGGMERGVREEGEGGMERWRGGEGEEGKREEEAEISVCVRPQSSVPYAGGVFFTQIEPLSDFN